MTGIVLGARERARGLAALDPCGDMARGECRIGGKGTGLDDRVVGQEVQVCNRREDPVDADAAGLVRRDRAGPPRHLEAVERGECTRRRKLREPVELLAGAALQVRREEEGPAGLTFKLRRQGAHRLGWAPEDDEPPDAQREGLAD